MVFDKRPSNLLIDLVNYSTYKLNLATKIIKNMKSLITVFLTFSITFCFSQAKLYQSAIINTTTNVIAPEEEDVQNLQNNQDGRGMNFRNMMDGETKFVTYLKNDFVKTTIKSEMGKGSVYRDNSKQLTSTVFEMMGNKMGFYFTDEDQEEMQKRRDSMMAERRKRDTTQKQTPQFDRSKFTTEIAYTNESKKIAGYNCKKAYLVTTRLLGVKDSSVFWYSPEIKFNNLYSTGGFSNMPGMMSNMAPTLNGLEKLDGFVIRYEMNMRRNRRMEVEVTKIVLDKEIDSKEFDIPKDIEMKPMKEMGNMFGGGRGGFMRGRD